MYFLVLVLINTVLSVPIMLVTLSSMRTVFNGMFQRLGFGTQTGSGIVMFAVMMIIGALVLLFIGAAWLHLRVYLFGGRKGYRETLKALAFGETPALLLGWIPLVGMLGGIWSLPCRLQGSDPPILFLFRNYRTSTAADGGILLMVHLPGHYTLRFANYL